MEGVELLSVRVYRGQQKLLVLIRDGEAHHTISYVWKTRNQEEAPPAEWWSAVCGEIEWMRAQEQKRASGKLVKL